MGKISKSFGQLSGEELFKSISSRIDAAARPAPRNPEPEAPAAPDYDMDEFDKNNPFDQENVRPDASTPSPSPGPSPQPTATPPPLPTAEVDDEEEFPPPPSSPLLRQTWDQPAPTKFLEGLSESVVLPTVKQLITKTKITPTTK